MGNAEEFSGQRSDFTRMLPAHRRSGPGSGRIRYAHSGVLPRVEPLCTVPQAPAGHHRDDGGADGAWGARGFAYGTGGDDPWSTEFPPAGRRSDLWALICGGIAAVAAFAAAFIASGGLASHSATPGATRPAVVSQACPSAACSAP